MSEISIQPLGGLSGVLVLVERLGRDYLESMIRHHRCIITGTLSPQVRLLSHGIALDLPLGTYSERVSCLMLFAFG